MPLEWLIDEVRPPQFFNCSKSFDIAFHQPIFQQAWWGRIAFEEIDGLLLFLLVALLFTLLEPLVTVAAFVGKMRRHCCFAFVLVAAFIL
jgi:hypothetical protein